MNRLQNLASALGAVQRIPLAKAAPHLASNGWPVFPCQVGGKTPLNEHGLSEASTDAQVVERWWSRWPNANIGVATGARCGFDVIDVDVRDARSGYQSFAAASDRFGLDDWLIRVLTPSGGMHFYYPSPTHRVQRNWTCAEAAIDFRGAGGAIILPPSVGACAHDVSSRYTLIALRKTARAVDSVGLREFLDPRVAQRRIAAVVRKSNTATAGRDHLATWVAQRPEGERNTGLFWAACRMVEAGHAVEETVSAFLPAGELAGLHEREIVTTIHSAYRHTKPNPSPAPAPAPIPMGAQMVWNR